MKRRSVHVQLELRLHINLSRYIKEPQHFIYCLHFFKKLKNLNAETLFHTRSSLFCLVCRHIVSFLFAPWCIFHCMRTLCVVREQHGLSDIATITKVCGFLRRFNCLLLNSKKSSTPFYTIFCQITLEHFYEFYLINYPVFLSPHLHLFPPLFPGLLWTT